MKLSMLEIISIVQTVVQIVFAYVAIMGLSVWKKQFKGNQDHNLARSLLNNLYKYRVALFAVRNPLTGDEYPVFSEKELKIMMPGDKNYRKYQYIYKQRWQKVQDLRVQLDELMLEAMALWPGLLLEDKMKKIYFLEKKLWIELTQFIENQNPQTEGKIKYDNAIIYDSWDEKDLFRIKVETIIEEINNLLCPKLIL